MRVHYPLRLADGHGDDGVEEEVVVVLILPAAAMDATAFAHATSSRFIRASSPQTTGSTGRPLSAARNTGGGPPAEISPSQPPAAWNGRRSSSTASAASRAIDLSMIRSPPARTHAPPPDAEQLTTLLRSPRRVPMSSPAQQRNRRRLLCNGVGVPWLSWEG